MILQVLERVIWGTSGSNAKGEMSEKRLNNEVTGERERERERDSLEIMFKDFKCDEVPEDLRTDVVPLYKSKRERIEYKNYWRISFLKRLKKFTLGCSG